ncbi:hypothetical protein F5B22DRAFT_640309 [Xylaria bambusicola]|uniref:uncharacterized protein n=1 Tax=Xylaria bambusicola TaxID=326684 RepID=UPI0020087BD9|nr:uncharacterized protein F5B22DRAFT_640309 [Xylaria bambusicola]KAI0503206.1 hypothetical protein F5B22DRAFT_640309 [Xylaria bambusicola]
MANGTGTGLHVAIIGGGITGVILALGLEQRGVSYTLYERAPAFTEIGAGIGFSPNAERALKVVDPKVYSVYKKVASTTGDEEDYFNWADGHKSNEMIARLLIGVDAFQGGRRSDFLEAWSTLIPSEKVRFGKEFLSAFEREDGKVSLKFKDEGVDEADIVIGCDGIRSRVRQIILGENSPAAHPKYTNKFCFRALLPMDKARAVLGTTRTESRFMYNGPGRHAITYAVANGALLNALFVIHDPNPWPFERHTAPGTKQEVVDAYADWHPAVRGLVDLLPEKLDKWAIFDMYDDPAPYYNRGAIALAGDAAHASGPHLGSGAGFGIEDGLVLATILQAADEEIRVNKRAKAEVSHCALEAYNKRRYDRSGWLPGATREAVDLFQMTKKEWHDEDRESYLRGVSRLYHYIWDQDIDEMVKEATLAFHDQMHMTAA